MKITKEFIKDLKKANNISVRIKRTGNFESTANLTLTVKEKTNSKGWVKPEIRTDYNSFPASLPTGYNEAWYWSSYKELSGFEALQHIIRDGDELRFHSMINNNGYLDKAMIPHDTWKGDERHHHCTYNNLYHEVLTVKVTRKQKVIVHQLKIEEGGNDFVD